MRAGVAKNCYYIIISYNNNIFGFYKEHKTQIISNLVGLIVGCGDFMKLKLRQNLEAETEPKPALHLRGSHSDGLRNKSQELDRSPPPTKAVVPDTIKPFLELWFQVGGMKHGILTKTLKEGVKGLKQLRRGIFFKDKLEFEKVNGRLQLSQWETVLERYQKAMSPEYLPIQKGGLKVSLPAFMFNSFAKTVQSKSWLLHFMEHEPERKTPERFPKMTEALIKAFGRVYLNDEDYVPNASEVDRFILGANRLGMFFVKNQRKMSPHFRLTDYKKAELVVKAVKSGVGKNTMVTPGFLCSNLTFDIRLPVYLKEQAIFSSVDRRRFR